MLAILITIFFLLFSYLSWKKPNWAVALVCFALPSYLIRFKIWFAPFTLLELMILVLFAVWLMKYITVYIKEKEKPKLNLEFKWLIIIFIIAATISIFTSPDLKAAAGIYKAYFIEPILFFFVFINLIKTKKDADLILKSLGLSALIISAFAIYQKFTGVFISNPYWQAEQTRRVTSFFAYPNAVGLFLAPIITLYIGQIIKHPFKGFRNLFRISVIAISIPAIVWAVSEGAIVAVLAGSLLAGMLIKKSRPLTFAIALIIILAVISSPTALEKVKPKILFKDVSGQIRIQMWKETFSMLKEKPLLGAGLAGYQTAISPYHVGGVYIKTDNPDFLKKVLFDEEFRKQAWQPFEIYLYPHNFILNFWSEIGFLGLMAIFAIIIKFYWLGFKNLKNNYLAAPLLGSMTALLVHGIVDAPYFKNDLSVLFWLITALMVVNIKITEKDKKIFK